MADLDAIAGGGAFDSVEAIRTLAAEVTRLNKLLGNQSLPRRDMPTPALSPQGMVVALEHALSAANVTTAAAALIEVGIPVKAAAALAAAGYTAIHHLTEASNDDLAKVDGIGPGTIALIRRKLAGK